MIRKKRIAVFTGKRGGSGALIKIMNGIKKIPYLEMKPQNSIDINYLWEFYIAEYIMKKKI